jgi:hypothetical protein
MLCRALACAWGFMIRFGAVEMQLKTLEDVHEQFACAQCHTVPVSRLVQPLLSKWLAFRHLW